MFFFWVEDIPHFHCKTEIPVKTVAEHDRPEHWEGEPKQVRNGKRPGSSRPLESFLAYPPHTILPRKTWAHRCITWYQWDVLSFCCQSKPHFCVSRWPSTQRLHKKCRLVGHLVTIIQILNNGYWLLVLGWGGEILKGWKSLLNFFINVSVVGYAFIYFEYECDVEDDG